VEGAARNTGASRLPHVRNRLLNAPKLRMFNSYKSSVSLSPIEEDNTGIGKLPGAVHCQLKMKKTAGRQITVVSKKNKRMAWRIAKNTQIPGAGSVRLNGGHERLKCTGFKGKARQSVYDAVLHRRRQERSVRGGGGCGEGQKNRGSIQMGGTNSETRRKRRLQIHERNTKKKTWHQKPVQPREKGETNRKG